jgi:Fuc2NAc and GlcNAc transferase
MSPLMLILTGIVIAGVLAASFGFTIWVIRNAYNLGLIDIPNQRSSHTQPTPRGGGVVFTVTFYLGLIVLFVIGVVDENWILGLLIGGPLVAIVGFLDDRKSLPALMRLAVHFVAAIATFAIITRMFAYHIEISFLPTDNQVFLGVFCVLYIMWMVNLYNFMDGIDGMAGTQGVVAALLSAALSFWQGSPQLGAVYLLLAASVGGFLFHNWSPAKIFMGDCGAYFLGFAFATLALISKVYLGHSIHAHMILLGVFICDATYTLVLRAIQGKRIYQAHRDHAFQHAVQRGLSHRRVNLMWNAVTAFWLGPVAMASVLYPLQATMFLLLGYSPLIVMVAYMKAGIEIKFTETADSPRKKNLPGQQPWV